MDSRRRWRQQLPARLALGRIIERLWDLLAINGAEIAGDVAVSDCNQWRQEPLTAVAVLGPKEWLYVHPAAVVEPQVVIDTRPGPVVLEAGCCVQAFTRLEGPCVIGAGSIIYGAHIRGGTTIGPHCRIGGEVENSVILGYSNKYHEGFLGHSYVGCWVNLAAGTHTSDLRCDYRHVTVPTPRGVIDSGQRKLGAFVGDHVKTGLGVLLDAGSVLGPFAQVLPMSGFAPRVVPAFHRVGPTGAKLLHDIERLLATVRLVFERRGCQLAPQLEQLYRYLAAEAVQVEQSLEPAVVSWRRSA
jgi:UDP-N-acetylglucosamine diphosphorylase/glucosamine-1-phosphate N-acetyltransferase